ncbi:MAG TPA: PilZ domain-containing protein [Steroidobacteraceae bacterium]|nr:PilZ domain-containing protein [Steroidobacteraceae bacterium]
MERHRGQRRATDVVVRFVTRPHTIGTGRIVNISATGAFMETDRPLRPLSLLYVEPVDPLPADGTGGRIAATVVRCGPTGVGLEWCEFAAEATTAYARLAAVSNDLADAQQRPLPEMPEAIPLPHRASRTVELAGLCRLEFRD